MLTSAPSNVISRATMMLSSRFRTSLTRNLRCFIFDVAAPLYRGAIVRRPRRQSAVATASQFLCDLLELIALDDIAHLIFVEVAEFDAAFKTRAHFFHVVLETAQC